MSELKRELKGVNPSIQWTEKWLKGSLQTYFISESDEFDKDWFYYGFLRKDGAWYILRTHQLDKIVEFRYAKGDSDYVANWDNKENLTYDYFDVIF